MGSIWPASRYGNEASTALVMEGYTDVIVAHQFGFQNAVAVLGTALGESHIRILKSHADRIVLVLDGDKAGTKRANEVLELFVAEQADLRILTLPEGLDPCDYLHKYGAAAFSELLATKAVDALDHAFEARPAASIWSGTFTGPARIGGVDRHRGEGAAAGRHDTTRDARFREEKILHCGGPLSGRRARGARAADGPRPAGHKAAAAGRSSDAASRARRQGCGGQPAPVASRDRPVAARIARIAHRPS